WRTTSGVSICLLTGKIWPSILILIGAYDVKNRSDARLSTISLNSGLVLRTTCRSSPPSSLSTTSPSAAIGLSANHAFGFLFHDSQGGTRFVGQFGLAL